MYAAHETDAGTRRKEKTAPLRSPTDAPIRCLGSAGWEGATIYLGSFCVSSTLTMGAFAAFYGECTHHSQRLSERLPYILAFVSGSTSVLVGTIWLICSATVGVDAFLEFMGFE